MGSGGSGIVSFCVGTGRCGTTFLARVAAREPHVAASHERLRLAACFHMYCAWNGIAVDPAGFLADRRAAVAEDLAAHDVSFEASALVSHSLLPLHAAFGARFLLLVRRPDHTVGSFAVRGWFERPIARSDAALPPSYREGEEPRHFFGRILPRGQAAFDRWAALPPVGRLAWFWAARNRAILEQFRALPPRACRIARLEDLDYDGYRDVAAFLGWRPTLDRAGYDALAAERLNTGPRAPRLPDAWTPEEVAAFEAEVATVARALGYRHELARLTAGGSAVASGEGASLAVGDVLERLDAG